MLGTQCVGRDGEESVTRESVEVYERARGSCVLGRNGGLEVLTVLVEGETWR